MAQASKPSRLLTMKNHASGQSLASHAQFKKVHSIETRHFANDCESQEKIKFNDHKPNKAISGHEQLGKPSEKVTAA